MRIVYLLFIIFATSISTMAQTQQGFVKTLGRPNKPGVPLENVTIQMVGMMNPVTTSSTGEFRLSAYKKKYGAPIKLLNVRVNDYAFYFL